MSDGNEPRNSVEHGWDNDFSEAYVYDTQNLDNPELRPAVENVLTSRVKKSHTRPAYRTSNATDFFQTDEEVWIPGETSADSYRAEEESEEETPTHFGVPTDTKKERILKRLSIIVLVFVPLAIISYILYQTIPLPGK